MTYKQGDAVSYKGNTMPAKVLSGPYPTYGADRWLIEKADGKVTLARGAELEPVKDRRRKVAETLHRSLSMWGATKPFASLPATVQRTYLTTADKVLAALDEEAEVKPEPEKPALAEGDRIRILKRSFHGAQVLAGDVLTVQSVTANGYFYTNAPRSHNHCRRWIFSLATEGTGWERV